LKVNNQIEYNFATSFIFGFNINHRFIVIFVVNRLLFTDEKNIVIY